MRNKKVGNNARLCRFKWSFFKAMTLRREGSCRRFTLDHSPGSRPTLRRKLVAASFPRSCCFSAKKEKFQDASFCIYDPQMFSAYNKFLINPGVPSGFPQLTNTWPRRPFLQIGQWRQIAQRISGEVKKGNLGSGSRLVVVTRGLL